MSGGGGGAAYVPEMNDEGMGSAAFIPGMNVEGWGGATPKTSEEIHADTLLGILKEGQSSPSKFSEIFKILSMPSFGQQSLIQPVLDTTKEFVPIYEKQEGKKKKTIPGHPIHPTPAYPQYEEIIEKAFSGRVANPVELRNVNENGKVHISSNAVRFGYAGAETSRFINVVATKKAVKIHDDIVEAVYNVFSDPSQIKAKWATNPAAFPIYLIGALPKGGRHLTIVVILRGKVYSCGVVSVGESGATGDTEAGEDGMGYGSAMGGAAAASSVAFGGIPNPAAPAVLSGMASAQFAGVGAGFVSGLGSAAGERRQVIGSGSSPSGQAQIVSPDWMFDIYESRFFDIGILLPEHLVKLQTYFVQMKGDVRMTFKNTKSIGHAFDHFEFPLDARFAMISNPLIVETFKNYINCTTFVLSVFKNINCGTVAVDPSECLSKKYTDDSVTGGAKILQNIIRNQLTELSRQSRHMANIYASNPLKQRWYLWLLSQDNKSVEKYIIRDLYISIILFRYFYYYLTTQDPNKDQLFDFLVKHYDQSAEETIRPQKELLATLTEQATEIRKLQEEHDEALKRKNSNMSGKGGSAAAAGYMSNEGGRRRRRTRMRPRRRCRHTRRKARK